VEEEEGAEVEVGHRDRPRLVVEAGEGVVVALSNQYIDHNLKISVLTERLLRAVC
jgi:hypothetical protein